ncbi:MAG: type I glyceraldehyde-3-phosphate dehydrogenase, partial [Candidatus Desantisbacteria bacterium]
VDLVAELERDVTVEEVNQALKTAASTSQLAKYLEYCEEPLVSCDFNDNPKSSIVDAGCTSVIGGSTSGSGNMVKVIAWYDNEWGYSCRVMDLIEYVAGR